MQIEDTQDRINAFLERKFRHSRSFHTKNAYKSAMNRFEKFLRIKYNLDVNQLLRQFEAKQLDPIGTLDEFYSYLSNEHLSNRSISIYVVVAKEFFNSQGLHIYNEDIKQRFRLPKAENTYEEGLTKEILVRILHNSNPKLQTAILISASSGMRISELVQLKISDIDFSTTPTTIRIRKETTKTRETRFTCISAEATKSLKDYLRRTFGWVEVYSEDRYIFLHTFEERLEKLRTGHKKYSDNNDQESILSRMNDLQVIYESTNEEERYFKAVSSARATLEDMLTKVIVSIPELAKKLENGRNSIHFHAFRAWFKTQVTNAHQSDFAEALMGHKSIKLTYFRQNVKDRLKTYLEVESALTVSDFSAVENTIEGLQKQVEFLTTELEKVKQLHEVSERYEKINVH
jgi:integrase